MLAAVAKDDGGDEAMWNAKQVAKVLNVSESWVYGRAARGKLPSVKIGGVRRFDPSVIRALKAKASTEE